MRGRMALILIALWLASLAGVAASPARDGPSLRLHRSMLYGQFSTGNASLLAASAPGSYAIIQFGGPITLEDRAALEATGVTVLEYLPDFAYLVRGASRQLDAAAQVSDVYARHSLMLADKLAPSLLRALAGGSQDLGRVRAIGWPDDAGELAADVRTASLDLSASITADEILRLARMPTVRWIEPVGQPHLLNDVARSIMHVDAAWQNRSLFGAGQIVAVTDSGLDTGITATLSADFAGRLVATHVISAGGDLADQNGHGTHVAGSVAGAGVQSGANPAQHQYAGSFAGVAPEAGLVVQAFEADPLGAITGLPDDYYPMFSQTYADGARLHTNSWGDYTGPISDTEASFGGYPYGSQRTDQFIWDHLDMTIFFAAGNSGTDGTPGVFGFCTGGDGVVDPDSLLAPATAKNVITVGASENNRSSGGYGGFPWLLVSLCFSTNPIALDTLANDPDGMAAFSSRGPADDGRVKPDLVAPGTNIVSTFSHDPNVDAALWLKHESNPNYAYNNGTSMATPLAAGVGALAREWLVQKGIAKPSAAAVKATLLNTTADIAPGQYGEGTTQEIPSVWPNNVAGWGRIDLSFIDTPNPYAFWIDDHSAGLATGQMVTYTHTSEKSLTVVDSAQPLRVMLVWTDPPASLSASAQLVNDLDLVVIGPDGAMYYGNSVTGDRINNVEGVIIDQPALGAYSVRVRAFNVPIASQPYALAVGGPVGALGGGQNIVRLPVVRR